MLAGSMTNFKFIILYLPVNLLVYPKIELAAASLKTALPLKRRS
jgi:hypothetical protein